jgi:hypothetical protein|tara:strand:+ start:1185 stop:1442 length:258 start_codon:yes stop_codon:yes gene_type:complete
VLRFDCFYNQPHCHLGWSDRDEPFIRIETPDPLTWTLHAIEHRLDALLEEAGAVKMTAAEFAALPEIVAQLAERTPALCDQVSSR